MAKKEQESQGPTAKAAPDPTVRRGPAPEYPAGTHPLVPPDKQTWGPNRFKYSDLEDDLKPDKSTVAQTVEDPMVENMPEPELLHEPRTDDEPPQSASGGPKK